MKQSIALVFPKCTFLETPMVWMPLGLMYLSAQLEAQGHHTEFFDLNKDELPADGDFDQLWLSSTSPQMQETKRIAEIVSDWKQTKTVLGGAGAWANPATHIKLGFDLIISGESDHPDSVKRILETVQKCDKNSHITIPVSRTLNWVLPPNRRWAHNYHAYMNDDNGTYRMSSLFTSRGCPLTCAFCESGRHGIIWDKFTRYENLDIVERQIQEIKNQGFTGLAYYDDVLPLNKKRTLEIMGLHRKYDMRFRCFLRTDIISEHGGKEYLQQLRDGGLIEIFVGVESADNHIKENIHKKTTIEQDTNILNWCKEMGITYKASFILGLPGESMESMEKTRAWILSQDTDKLRVQVGRLIPFPGTPLGDHPENFDLQYDRQVDDNYFYAGNGEMDSFVSTSHLSRQQIDDFWKKLTKEIRERGYKP